LDSRHSTGWTRLDYDRDGDLDLLVGPHTIDKPVLYENRGEGGNWLRLDLHKLGAGHVLGAEVWITADEQTQYRVRNSRTDFLSQESRVLHIGLGDASQFERVRVVWLNGATTTVRDVHAGRLLCLRPMALTKASARRRGRSPLARNDLAYDRNPLKGHAWNSQITGQGEAVQPDSVQS
jgi:hypothetical protein